MLFKSLSLKNFKCFEEVDVDFAPITLLTGANSSGKSSLLYSILAMLQTEQFPLYLSPNGKYVEMGSMKEMVFQGDQEREMEISTVLYTPDYLNNKFNNGLFSSIWNYDQKNGLPILKSFNVSFGSTVYSVRKISNDVFYFNYKSTNFQNEDQIIYEANLETLNSNEYFNKGVNLSQKYKEIYFENIPFKSIQEFIDSTSKITDINLIERKSIFDSLSAYFESINNWFNYIGSFRLPQERTYYQKAKAQEKVGVNGEGYIDQIIEWEETNPAKFEELNRIMADLELIESIKSDKMKGGRFELTVRTKKNSTSAALTDVGFGISQFLPVIVADLQLPDTSCLALSQPEIHLHPKIQALFGNYLASQIGKSSKQYIVETHSEYLLNRIRLLLVKGTLKSEDVQVYYFENDGLKSIVHRIEFTTDGQIIGAPEGFFDTYGMDVMDIALNA